MESCARLFHDDGLFRVQPMHEEPDDGLGVCLDLQAVTVHVGQRPGQIPEALRERSGGVSLAQLFEWRSQTFEAGTSDSRRLRAAPQQLGAAACLALEELDQAILDGTVVTLDRPLFILLPSTQIDLEGVGVPIERDSLVASEMHQVEVSLCHDQAVLTSRLVEQSP